jgi:hypothetical protein
MPKLKYTKELLEPIVKESFSTQEVMKKLGLKLTGGSNSHLKKKFVLYNLDYSHFNKHGSNHKGGAPKVLFEQVLVLNRLHGRRENVFRLKRAMLESGFKEECAICFLPPEWNGKPLTLQIDHINGNGLDNRKENVRFLCPSCHSQTETFGTKNIK